jgi:type VI secretion system protein ImpK
VGAGRFKKQYSVPVWFTVVALTLTLLGLFAWYKYQLVRVSTDVESRVRAIGAMHPPPLPAAKKALRLKELLATEIARGSVSVEEDNSQSAISFQGDSMFAAGHARLNATMLPTVIKVANEINDVSGAVHITGHSDDRPIKTREFPSNQALSEKRAASIADVFKRSGVAPDRMHVEGKGGAQPLADNTTSAGRARNRRVDIVVSYDESPFSH